MADKLRLDRPEHPQRGYLGDLINQLFTARIAVIVLGVICVFLIVLIISLTHRPILVSVVDMSSGKTFMTKTQELDKSILERQLLYYTRQFCEDYFSLDHTTITDHRKRALEIMHPEMRSKLVKFDDDQTVRDVLGNMTTCSFDWKITTVTARDDPRYATFCQFDRTTYREGYKPFKESFNIKCDWGQLTDRSSPFERPHQLILLKVYELKEGSKELSDQLNLSY